MTKIQQGDKMWFFRPNTNERIVAEFIQLRTKGNVLMGVVKREEDGKLMAVPMRVLRAL